MKAGGGSRPEARIPATIAPLPVEKSAPIGLLKLG
jgi:hypothetical protein